MIIGNKSSPSNTQKVMSSKFVYLSLGDKEEKARNPVMAAVGDRIREAYGLLREQGINATLEWNQGNHFKDADIRTAKAFAWVIKEQGEDETFHTGA